MDYYQLITQVIEALEDDSAMPNSLAELSQRYYLSYFHFSRVFQAVTHKTLKTYVDERRLNRAARLLRGSQSKIIDIALESGFQSHEVFSRRFHQAFGLSPSQYRRASTPPPLLSKTQVVARSLKQIGASIAADYRLIEQPEIRLWGQAWAFNPEETGAFDSLTHQVQAFVAKYITPRGIQQMLSVITRLEDKASSPIDETLCCFGSYEAEAGSPPAGLTELTLPAARFAVFRYQGDMGSIFETVFSDICLTLIAADLELSKSGLEFYNLYEGNYFQDGWFKIYVPVA